MKNKSKVFIAVFLLVIVAVILLFVFKPFKVNNNENNINKNDISTEYVDLRYDYHVMESNILSEDQNIIISNYEDLKNYISSVEDMHLLDMLKMYDEEFFMGQSLIILRIRDDLEMEPVKSVKKELNSNVINILIDDRELEEFVTPNMVTNNIVIEVNSEYVQDINGLEVKIME